jgi:CBS domain-containing protein
MSTPISSMMSTPALSVAMDDTIQAVEALMQRHKLSCVPVTEPDGAPVGVLSLSDLMAFHARNEDAATAFAWQICHYKPIAVRPNTSIADAARLMLAHQVHHVVVMEDDVLVGIVSALDFVRRFAVDAEPGK